MRLVVLIALACALAITVRADGQPFDFSVGPKGSFLGMDDERLSPE